VAAIIQLAHRLHGDPSLADIGAFTALYLAVWTAWTSFTLYANVVGDRTRLWTMLLGMFGIAVMAAAVPQATGDRAVTFAAAYVIVRMLGLRTWARTRQTMLAWPSVQVGFGVVPWIVSLFVGPPGRYALWAFGLALEILLPIVIAGRVRRDPAPRPGKNTSADGGTEARLETYRGEFKEAHIDLPHLAERLGLFMIVVLGEGVIQVVAAAAEVPWTAAMVVVEHPAGEAEQGVRWLLWAAPRLGARGGQVGGGPLAQRLLDRGDVPG
jgi:low temperature requirement protein LtrA